MITVHTFDLEVVKMVQGFVGQYSHLNAFFSSDHTVDIVGRGSTKDIALLYLAKHLQLEMKNVAAVGDGLNDLAMVKCAGIALAPTNAMEGVKKASNFICRRSNEESAVSEAIQYVLKNI
jgi:hydroxymethylpyrimidine pyrophosphatase-like HAD family hydrolase